MWEKGGKRPFAERIRDGHSAWKPHRGSGLVTKRPGIAEFVPFSVMP
jgi:hypothetical protein